MPASKSELIINLGVEGGAADVRRAMSADGTSTFLLRTYGGGFDLSEFEHDSPAKKQTQNRTFTSLQAALEAFSGGSEWVLYYPTSIHRDFRDEVWELREQCLARIERSDGDFHRHINGQWQQLCGRDRPSEVASPPESPKEGDGLPS